MYNWSRLIWSWRTAKKKKFHWLCVHVCVYVICVCFLVYLMLPLQLCQFVKAILNFSLIFRLWEKKKNIVIFLYRKWTNKMFKKVFHQNLNGWWYSYVPLHLIIFWTWWREIWHRILDGFDVILVTGNYCDFFSPNFLRTILHFQMANILIFTLCISLIWLSCNSFPTVTASTWLCFCFRKIHILFFCTKEVYHRRVLKEFFIQRRSSTVESPLWRRMFRYKHCSKCFEEMGRMQDVW